jgi:hypothetical protein
MGMFDTVTCHYPIEGMGGPFDFQTKQFDCCMDHYTITAEGRLIHHQVAWKPVPESQRPYYGKPEWEQGGIWRSIGSITTIPAADVDTNFHGDIELRDFTLRFTDGQVSKIIRGTES